MVRYPLDTWYMKEAIAVARQGMAKGQTPFGCCIVRKRKVIVCAHNTVWQDHDITAHAEMNAIRRACRLLRSVDLFGCVVYSTCEPCPMCFSACHWARVSRVVYGARIEDARAAGFHELGISAARMKRQGGSGILLKPGVLRQDAKALFDEWRQRPAARPY